MNYIRCLTTILTIHYHVQQPLGGIRAVISTEFLKKSRIVIVLIQVELCRHLFKGIYLGKWHLIQAKIEASILKVLLVVISKQDYLFPCIGVVEENAGIIGDQAVDCIEHSVSIHITRERVHLLISVVVNFLCREIVELYKKELIFPQMRLIEVQNIFYGIFSVNIRRGGFSPCGQIGKDLFVPQLFFLPYPLALVPVKENAVAWVATAKRLPFK